MRRAAESIPSGQVRAAGLAVLTYICVLLTACSSSSDPIEIDRAWAPPTPPNATVGAVYMELTAREADRLVSASSSAAERVEVHQTSVEDGTAKMRLVESLLLKKRENVALAPGGTHFMLIGLTAPLEVGNRFPLELQFEKAGTIVLDIEVMAADADHSHH